MMYRDSSYRVHAGSGNLRLQRRVLTILCAVLLIATAVLAVTGIRNSGYRRQAETQIHQRMISASTAAIDEVNRMNSIVTSNTPARLAKVRQYVYLIDQLNNLSMTLNGGEAGRLVEADVFTALYADLDSLDSIIQANKSSTQDGRAFLLGHLELMQKGLSE